MAKLFVYPTNVNLCGLYIAVHGVFLAVFCFVFIHVQVSLFKKTFNFDRYLKLFFLLE